MTAAQADCQGLASGMIANTTHYKAMAALTGPLTAQGLNHAQYTNNKKNGLAQAIGPKATVAQPQ